MSSALAITLHGIYNNEKSLADYEIFARPYFVSKEMFKNLLGLIVNQRSSTVSNFLHQSTGNWNILTFDDGLVSDFRIAFPILIENNLSATFFITVQNIGKKNYCSVSELREMIESGMEIGSHGLTHEYLITMENKDVLKQIADSKNELEQLLGIPILSFAPVGGHFQNRIVNTVKEAGYKCLATMIPGVTTHEGEFLKLRRNHLQNLHDIHYMTDLIDRNRYILARNYLKYQVLTFLRALIGINNYDFFKRKLFD